MYQNYYIEVLENAHETIRANERAAIIHSIQLIERAEQAGPNSREAVEALLFLRKLWEFFLVHLASNENHLPEKLRADIISIGLSILRQAEQMKQGQVREFRELKEISQIIAEGLS